MVPKGRSTQWTGLIARRRQSRRDERLSLPLDLPSLDAVVAIIVHSSWLFSVCTTQVSTSDVACSVWVAIFFNTRNDGDVDYIVRVAIQ